MYDKINKISKFIKQCKDRYNESGILVTNNYAQDIEAEHIKARITRKRKQIDSYVDDLEWMNETQRRYFNVGEIDDALTCQFEITKLRHKITKAQAELLELQRQYKFILNANEQIKRQIKK